MYLTSQPTLSCFICCFQVSFSQMLGVIGYSLLPLVITASVLPFVHSFIWFAMFVKVGELLLGIVLVLQSMCSHHLLIRTCNVAKQLLVYQTTMLD